MDITTSLDRFLTAQERSYDRALREIKNGKKESHWMWYIFPQLRGLGRSHMSYYYGITDRSEAAAYLAHPTLSARLYEITSVLLTLPDTDPVVIFGQIDAQKLRSSMTLFSAVSAPDSIYQRVLEKFFGGAADQKTLSLLSVT